MAERERIDFEKRKMFNKALYMLASLVNPKCLIKCDGKEVGNPSLWHLAKVTIFYADIICRKNKLHFAEVSRYQHANSDGVRSGSEWLTKLICFEDLPFFTSPDTNLTMVAATFSTKKWNENKPEGFKAWNRFFINWYEETMAESLPGRFSMR